MGSPFNTVSYGATPLSQAANAVGQAASGTYSNTGANPPAQSNAQQVQANMASNPMMALMPMIMQMMSQSMYNPAMYMMQNPQFRDLYQQQMMMQMQGGMAGGMAQLYQLGQQFPWMQNIVHGQIADYAQKMQQQQAQQRQWNYAVNQPAVQMAMMHAIANNDNSGNNQAFVNKILNGTPYAQNAGQAQQDYQLAHGVTPTATPGPYSQSAQWRSGTNLDQYNMQSGTPIDQSGQSGDYGQKTAQQQNP